MKRILLLALISAGNTMTTAFNAGDAYQVNQVRVGVGFRF